MNNYMKEREEQMSGTQKYPQFGDAEFAFDVFNGKKNKLLLAMMFSVILFTGAFYAYHNLAPAVAVKEESVSMVLAPIAATSSKKSVITIPAGTVKSNPFVPYRNIDGADKVVDVPSFTLVEPPEVVAENSDAARVMDTIVSGILYDKFSPSAILNIEGNDYLVKKGDVVNNYNVINIAQDSVTVKLGSNVYKAGIGEMLTEGTLKHNEVSNLSNKFGGGK